MKVYYSSLIWEEFTTYVNHSKKVTEIASARFWILVLIEAYQQDGIQVPEGIEVVFSYLHIPKTLVDDTGAFLMIGIISDAILELVPLSNFVLI